MNVVTYEAVVENGHVQLPAGVLLPEKAKVYVIVPGLAAQPVAHIASPRLVHPEEAADVIVKELLPESDDAGL
jgi:hypothetical protein